MMLTPKFKLEQYEASLVQSLAMSAGPEASLRQRAVTWLQRKQIELQKQDMPGQEVAKAQLKVLTEMTPEEKAMPLAAIGIQTKERIAAKIGQTPAEVTLMLARFDHVMAVSEWFRWRRLKGMILPISYAQMSDFMKEDRRKGMGMPRKDMNEIRMKKLQKKGAP